MEHTIQVQKEDMIFNVLSIGEVKSGETANATITGKEPNQVLNLTLPKGDTGSVGPQGATGPKGNDGYTPIRGTDYWTTSDKQEIVNNVLNEVNIPSKTSELINDSGFITNAVNDLVNYYLKSDTYSKSEVNTLVNNITKVTISIVDSLPTTGESNIIYFVPKTGSTNDVYDEYVWITNAWEHIGSTNVDLTGYATENWVNTQIANFLTEAQVNTLITNALNNYSYTEIDPTVPSYVKSITEADITNWNNSFSGDFNELTNLPLNIQALTQNTNIYTMDKGVYTAINNISVYYRKNKSLSMCKNDILIVSGSPTTTVKMFILIGTQDQTNYITNVSIGQSNIDIGFYKSLSSSASLLDYQGDLVTSREILTKTNTTEFNPTGNYNPATKKYVDDTIKSKINATFTLDGTTLNINTEA